MSDIAEIERLRKLLSDTNTYYAECIAEREDLRAENEKLRAALKPFADAYKDMIADDDYKWKDFDHLWESAAAMSLCVGDLRAARAALEKKDG